MTVLFDGTGVDSRTLVTHILKAAFLAREDAGEITLCVEGSRVVSEPTGVRTDWPTPSL